MLRRNNNMSRNLRSGGVGDDETDSCDDIDLMTKLKKKQEASGKKYGKRQGGAKTNWNNLEETMKVLSLTRNADADPEHRLIKNRWSHPNGKNQPAPVLVMNLCVDDPKRGVYIPGEIAVCTFSVQDGISSYGWNSLIDPASHVPRGNSFEACSKLERMGIPPPGYSTEFQEYSEIVKNLETFLKEGTDAKPVSGLGHVLFCLKSKILSYNKALEWLYGQAGRKFEHKLMPLENLIVTLSMGGLKCLMTTKRKNSNADHFVEIVDDLNKTVSRIQSYASKHGSNSWRAKHRISKILKEFSIKHTRYNTGLAHYRSIGNSIRFASKRFDTPDAYLGAFLLEDHVAKYLEHKDYMEICELACEYHQDKMKGLPQDLVKNVKKMPGYNKPSYRLTRCALMNARRIIYMALDVMMFNYRIRAKEGRHYPFRAQRKPYVSSY